MTEAKLVPADEGGHVPEGDGWFVLNAKDARWLDAISASTRGSRAASRASRSSASTSTSSRPARR